MSKIYRCDLLDTLLENYVNLSESIGVCRRCYLRLCLWSAGLHVDPSFPHRKSPKNADTLAVLLSTASKYSYGSGIIEEVKELLKVDAEPSTVIVVEDLPSNEWLASKALASIYCAAEKPSLLCCFGHTWDLFLTHRELLRYSMCCECLREFWRWANSAGRVHWWTWSEKDPLPAKTSCNKHSQVFYFVIFLKSQGNYIRFYSPNFAIIYFTAGRSN